jgi:hypothetical protein
MSFANVNQIVTAMTNEQTSRADFNYQVVSGVTTTSITVGMDLSYQLNSYGGRNLYPGANLTWQSCNASSRFSIAHGFANGVVGASNTQHITNICTYTPATVGTPPPVGGFLILVDLQGYWPNVSYTTTSVQSLTGTPTLRYTNGEGCRLYLVTTTAAGATAQNIRIFYNGTSGTAANSDLTAMRVSSAAGQIPNSRAPNIYFPFAGGDTGVSNCINVLFSAASTAGSGALCLAKPLAYIPFTTAASVASEREFLYQTPTLPRIYDNACLVFLYVSNLGGSSSNIAVNSTFAGHIETVWG